MAARTQNVGFDYRLVRVAYILAALFAFALWYQRGGGLQQFDPASPAKMVYGGAERPFSARVLVPWTVRLAVAPIPAETRKRIGRDIAAALGAEPIRKFDLLAGAAPDFALEHCLIVVLNFAALLGFLFALKKLMEVLFEPSRWPIRAAPIAAVLMVPIFVQDGVPFMYDLPALLLFTVALGYFAERRWLPLYATVAVAALNKETAIFIAAVVLAVDFRSLPARSLLRRLALITVSWGFARLLAVGLSTPTTSAGSDHLPYVLPLNLRDLFWSPVWSNPLYLAATLFFVLLFTSHLAEKPRLLRRGSLVMVPFFAAYLWGGMWGEIRVFLEIYPIFFLLGYHTFVRQIGLELTARDRHGVGARPASPS